MINHHFLFYESSWSLGSIYSTIQGHRNYRILELSFLEDTLAEIMFCVQLFSSFPSTHTFFFTLLFSFFVFFKKIICQKEVYTPHLDSLYFKVSCINLGWNEVMKSFGSSNGRATQKWNVFLSTFINTWSLEYCIKDLHSTFYRRAIKWMGNKLICLLF